MTSYLREQLQSIYDQHGRLTPALVVERARDTTDPLHGHFEWNDTVAGERWRHHQAHGLIRSIKVGYQDARGEPHEVRSFHSFRSPEGEYHYEPLDKVVNDDRLSRILLADMEREWRTLKRRYDHYGEFYELIRRDLAA